jgi:diadenosine tetraphosphate (Ap4A) HIT family hydrolase
MLSRERRNAALARCPFCTPRPGEILLENSVARALLDLRPLCVGHVLVVPRAHCASVGEAQDPVREGTLAMARELAKTLRRCRGEAGVYEHGGSPICRPRECQGGPTHAHLHVLPVDEDLTSRWISDARAACATTTGVSRHYLYQEVWEQISPCRVDLPPVVPRHFIRRLLEHSLEERGVQWYPMGADPALHASATAQTRSLILANVMAPLHEPLLASTTARN